MTQILSRYSSLTDWHLRAKPALSAGSQVAVTAAAVATTPTSWGSIRGRWGVTLLPVGSPNSKRVAALNAGFALGLSRASRNQDPATRFVKFATSKATNLELITTTGSGIDPTRRSTLNSPRYSGFAPMVQRAARSALSGNGAIPWPTTDKSPELMEKLSDELSPMLHDRKTPVAAITDTQSAWQRILEQRS